MGGKPRRIYGVGLQPRQAGRKALDPTLLQGYAMRVRRRLAENGLSLKDLATRMGRDPNEPDQVKQVGRWVRRLPEIRNLLPLSRALGVSIDWLVTGEEGPAPAHPAALKMWRDFLIREMITRSGNRYRRVHLLRALPDPDDLWHKVIVDGIVAGYERGRGIRQRLKLWSRVRPTDLQAGIELEATVLPLLSGTPHQEPKR